MKQSDSDQLRRFRARTLLPNSLPSKAANARNMSGNRKVSNAMLDSERYRAHAAECLTVAEETADPYIRQVHLTLASSWMTLARDDEAVNGLLAGWGIRTWTEATLVPD